MITETTTTPTVLRTERGLSIAGTRITLYDIMDYVTADWPPRLIQDRLNLTEQQITDALAYITAHRAQVEAEYEEVVREAEANRQYWDERNRERLAKIAQLPSNPEQEELRARLQAWKARIGTNS
ncbi:MAG: DUF433 domain-containing protein [Chloroflexaceae bacterium]|jgi:uncharacterized protein (DUF433 family)|nr:DUF433 domain-containing protein [Chloroflexaceae bacterium]